MPREKIIAVLFEGGQALTFIEQQMAEVRKAIALDNIEKLLTVNGIDEVVLCTSYEDLAEAAKGLGARVELGPADGGFHFGQRLAAVIHAYAPEGVIYMGGASAPLVTPEELGWIASKLREQSNLIIMNNAQSADLMAFAPAAAINRIELPRSDNFLGYLLREAGLERVLMQNSARVNFDLDTPVDIMILSLQPGLGPRTAQAVKALSWDKSRLIQAREVLQKKEWAEIILIGRVGAPVMAFLNNHLKCRLRVFSEERGMKALGREDRGEVVSLIGYFLQEVGADRFFDMLARVGDVAFIDTRVIFAHMKKRVTEWDRFCSDLGLYQQIRDPDVQAFSKAAVHARIPVILGGHSLVSGGVWLLANS